MILRGLTRPKEHVEFVENLEGLYSRTSLKRTPSGPRKCVRYKEVSAKKRFSMRFLIMGVTIVDF